MPWNHCRFVLCLDSGKEKLKSVEAARALLHGQLNANLTFAQHPHRRHTSKETNWSRVVGSINCK